MNFKIGDKKLSISSAAVKNKIPKKQRVIPMTSPVRTEESQDEGY